MIVYIMYEQMFDLLPIEIRVYICGLVLERDMYIEKRNLFINKLKCTPSKKIKSMLNVKYMNNTCDIIEIYKNDPRCYKYIDSKLLLNIDFFISLVKINNLIIRKIPSGFSKDSSLLLYSIQSQKISETMVLKYFNVSNISKEHLLQILKINEGNKKYMKIKPKPKTRKKCDTYNCKYKKKRNVKHIRLKGIKHDIQYLYIK